MKTTATLLFLALLGLLRADPVVCQFDGHITGITYNGGPQFTDNQLAVNDAFQVTIRYLTNLSDQDADPSRGLYQDRSRYDYPVNILVTFGQLVCDAQAGAGVFDRLIVGNAQADTLAFAAEGAHSSMFSFNLTDSTGTALDSDALPGAVDPSQWNSGSLSLMQWWGTTITGTIDFQQSFASRTAQAVPDKLCTAVALIMALFSMLTFNVRRRA